MPLLSICLYPSVSFYNRKVQKGAAAPTFTEQARNLKAGKDLRDGAVVPFE